MRFQPGQSGNPAGRPPGSRNRKTVIVEEALAVTAQETAKYIIARAQCGDRTAMRLVMERTVPTGTDRPLQLELPPVNGPEDLIAAAGAVLNALASGEVSSRETVCLLTVVERLGRIAERAQQMIQRREERRDGPPAAASRTNGAGLYSPVNSGAATAAPVGETPSASGTANGERLYSSANSRDETSSAAVQEASPGASAAADGLYFPVNLPEVAPPHCDMAPPVSANGLDAPESSRDLEAAALVPCAINGALSDAPAGAPVRGEESGEIVRASG